MILTRDQLRAARVLLHLRQDQLAELSLVGVATIRRYEGGQDIGPLHLDALRRAVEDAGAVLISAEGPENQTAIGIGVALRREQELPVATRLRIAKPAEREARPVASAKGTRPRGRPTKKP